MQASNHRLFPLKPLQQQGLQRDAVKEEIISIYQTGKNFRVIEATNGKGAKTRLTSSIVSTVLDSP